MSKKKNISYLFGLSFLLLAGCDTDTATVPLPDDGERAVEVRLRASVCTVETTVGRSVIEGTALNTGDEIGIFLMRDSNFSTPYLQNLPYRYAEGGQLSLQPEGTKVYYPARQDTLYLYGYYPYTATAAADENGKVSIPVTAALEAKDATDYLYTGETKGSKKAAATAAGIAVSLKHALARLRLNISTDRPEYTADSYPVLQSMVLPPVRDKQGQWTCKQATSHPTIRTPVHPSAPITGTKHPRSTLSPEHPAFKRIICCCHTGMRLSVRSAA